MSLRIISVSEAAAATGFLTWAFFLEVAGTDGPDALARAHREWFEEAPGFEGLRQEGVWTRSLAVGREQFARKVQEALGSREGALLLRPAMLMCAEKSRSPMRPVLPPKIRDHLSQPVTCQLPIVGKTCRRQTMAFMEIYKGAINRLIHIASRKKRLALLEEHSRNGLPVALRPALQYLITGIKDEIAALAASEAEERRAAIAAEGKKKVPIWYSPKPGCTGDKVVGNIKPSPGKVLEFTMEKIARTGKSEKWGTVLHLLVREFECKRGIELGTCAGISALYLSSVPSIERLITVEGSTELSEIARTSLKNRAQVMVVNSLFDEAIDKEIASASELFDFAFIDGHHEKVATIHYFNRLAPYLRKGALVIFDDVSWSQDMRDAWEVLSERTEFVHAVDLGAIGVCIVKPNDSLRLPPEKWNMQPLIGEYTIGVPLGWKE